MKQLKCSECGTLNRIEAHSFRMAPLCGRCRMRLPEPLLNPLLRGAWLNKAWIALGVVVVLAGLGMADIHPGLRYLEGLAGTREKSTFADADRPQPKPVPAVPEDPVQSAPQSAPLPQYLVRPPSSSPSPSSPPLALPETGTGKTYLRTRTDHWIEIKIQDGPYANTLVRIYRVKDNAIVAERFIRAGGKLKIPLPAGTFVVRSASGRDWYGGSLYFGDATSFSEAEAQLDLRQDGTYYDMSLIPQKEGNLDTKSISRDMF